MHVERRVMVAVALLAAAVRVPGVYTQSFWQDEVASARIIDEPTFMRLLGHVARTESTPPLWYALAWLAHRAGTPLQDVRLLSVAAGALLAAAVVELAHRFVPLPLAALAGVLTALGGQLVVHGHELRAYELLALLSVVLARCLLAEVASPSRPRELALAAVVAAGGLTHYFFGFSVLAALAWLWLEPGVRAGRRRASAAILAGGAVAASWLPVMLEQYHQDRFWWIGAFRLRTVVAVPARLFTTAYANTTLGVAVSTAGLLLVVTGCLHLSRVSPAGRLVAVLALAPLAEAAVLWSGGVRIFSLRNLVGIAPFVAVGAVGALAALPWRALRLAAVAAACAFVLLSLGTFADGGVPRYDALAHALVADGWTPSQPVAVFGNFFRYRAPLEWYLPHRPLLDASRPRAGICRTVFLIHGVDVVRLRLDRPIDTVRRLRGATILADPARAPRCVRPITRGRLAALA
jgi:hypothetical protein